MVQRRKVPSLAEHRLGSWGVPASQWGTTVPPEERVGAVSSWVLDAARGAVFDPGDAPSGRGLTVVGDDREAFSFLAATIQDLLRERGFKQRYAPLPMDWMRWETPMGIHRSIRESSDMAPVWRDYPLLVLGAVRPIDSWATASLADLVESRRRVGNPTLLYTDPDTWSAFTNFKGVTNPYGPLVSVIREATIVVRLGKDSDGG